MGWQDFVITLAVIAFSYALIPQIIYNFKRKESTITLQTSLITTIGMYAIAITYLTMGLIFSTIICFITGTLWLTILTQKIIYN